MGKECEMKLGRKWTKNTSENSVRWHLCARRKRHHPRFRLGVCNHRHLLQWWFWNTQPFTICHRVAARRSLQESQRRREHTLLYHDMAAQVGPTSTITSTITPLMLALYYLNWMDICPMILLSIPLHFSLLMAWILKTHSWTNPTQSHTWWMVIVLTIRLVHVLRLHNVLNHPWRWKLRLQRLLSTSTLRENSSENLSICSAVGIQPCRTRPEGPNLVKKLKLQCEDLQPLGKLLMVRWRHLIRGEFPVVH